MRSQQTIKIIGTALFVGLVIIGCNKSAGPNSNIASVAARHGAAILQAQCLSCHGDDLIKQQRLSKVGWTKEVEKMVRWGADVKDADKESLVEYLTANYPARSFSKEPPTASAPPVDGALLASGKTILEAKCLTCHHDDLIQQQRLSKVGWTKEVEKMMRWGVEISDAEKASLVEYLTSNFNPSVKK